MNRNPLFALSALFFVVACGQQADEPAAEPEPEVRAIEALADEYLDAVMARYPSLGTQLSLDGARHDRLFDNSLEALANWQEREDAWFARLNEIPQPADVGSRDWVSHGILHEELGSAIALRVCRNELWQASAATGWHRGLPFLFEIQPVDTAEHRQQTLARLAEVDRFIDTEIANLRLGLETGYSAPRVTVLKVPGQVRALIDDDSIFQRTPPGESVSFEIIDFTEETKGPGMADFLLKVAVIQGNRIRLVSQQRMIKINTACYSWDI